MQSPPLFKILDMIKLNRINYRQKTVNKSCFVLSCRIKGESLFFYNGGEHKIKRGDVLYIPYGSNYLQESKCEEVITFHLEAYSELPENIAVYTPENPECIVSLFIKGYEIFTKKEPGFECLSLSVLYEILSHFDLSSNRTEFLCGRLFFSAIQYLEANMFDINFNVDELCSKTTISRAYFNRLFKLEYGMTPINYINKKRIEKAKILLKSGNYSNEEIALLCGFNDVKYFYVIFKKLTGKTTKQYIQNK